MYESLEDAGLVDRGGEHHVLPRPHALLADTAVGDEARLRPEAVLLLQPVRVGHTGAPLAVRDRAGGSIDAYAAAVGRWLVTRDGFDFLAYYLSDFDYASHTHGPGGAKTSRSRGRRGGPALLDAAGGVDEFLERYAVVLDSDHGQTRSSRRRSSRRRSHRSRARSSSPRRIAPARCTSGRARASTLRPRGAARRRALGRGELRREGDEAVARRDGEELRFRPNGDGWETTGDAAILDHPGRARACLVALATRTPASCSCRRPRAGSYADLGGSHHAGGGSHGSLVAGDSFVPLLTIGVDAGACADHRRHAGRDRALRCRAAAYVQALAMR